MAGPRTEGHAIAADVPHGTAFEHDLPSADRNDRGVQPYFRLREVLTGGRQGPVGVSEAQAAELNVLNPTLFCEVALQHQQLFEPRRDHHGLARLLTGFRNVSQLGERSVQIPLAWLAQCLAHVVHQVAMALGKHFPTLAGEHHAMFRRDHRGDPHARHRPLVERQHPRRLLPRSQSVRPLRPRCSHLIRSQSGLRG